MFHVGQKVVCVDNSEWGHKLTLNGVYTVNAVGWSFEQYWLGLSETKSLNCLQWRASRFRPIVNKKTDISIFTALLPPSEVKRREKV